MWAQPASVKTERTLTVTPYLFGAGRLVRFGMSEFPEHNGVGILLGKNEGESGRLGAALAGQLNRGEILFDGIEKAHPLVLDLPLQVLDNGRLNGASGQVFDLRGFYIICTSNIGAAEAARMERSEDTSVESAVNARLRQKLRPEFLGRFGRMLIFRKLGFETQVEIRQSKIEKALRLMVRKGHHLTVGDGVVNFLVSVGYNDEFGARPMQREVFRAIRAPVRLALMSGGVTSGTLNFGAKRGCLVIA